MGWFYPPPPQPPGLVPLPQGTTAWGNAPPNPIGPGALLAAVRSVWPPEQWPAQSGATIAGQLAIAWLAPPFPVPYPNTAVWSSIRGIWPAEAWPTQIIIGGNVGTLAGNINVAPVWNNPQQLYNIRAIWPAESWPAQTGATVAAQLATVQNPPTIFPAPSPVTQWSIKAWWPPELWYAQSECAVAGGLAQAQLPPAYVSHSDVAKLSLLQSAWPQETWGPQAAPLGAGAIPIPVTAVPAPVPHIETRLWLPEAWPAQTSAQGAASFAPILASVPYISISSQMAVRAVWAQEQWSSQTAAPSAAIPNIIPSIPTTTVPTVTIRLWPVESWPAQKGAQVAGGLAAPFVPPVAVPFARTTPTIALWLPERWSAQRAGAVSGASSVTPPPSVPVVVTKQGGRVVFDPKRVGTTEIRIFDFISALSPSEGISTAAVTSTVYSGTDPTPQTIVSGSAAINGTQVSQFFTAGVIGNIYSLVCKVTTTLGQTLELAAYLAIVPDLP